MAKSQIQGAVTEPVPVQSRFKIALFIAAAVLALTVLYSALAPLSPAFRTFSWSVLYPVRDRGSGSIEPVNETIYALELRKKEARLVEVLKAAATEDRTVILTALNEAWAAPNSVIDIFIQSFYIGEGTRGLLDHLVMVALDEKAYNRCISIHPHCYALTTEGVDFSGQQNYMTDGYMKMMWRRIDFLRVVLEVGYNFIFTDVDIMWFRNPMLHFYPDGDFQIACDHFVGNELALENRPNGGFKYVKSNNRTIKFYKFWYSSREKHPGRNEQDVFNVIKYDPFIKELGIKMRFLSTAYFGGLCEPSRDFNKVCTMHVNCCIGLSRKIHDLGVMLEDWRRFMSLPPSEKRSKKHKWRVPQNCSLAALHN